MLNMGMGELMIILVVALLVLGPQRIPEVASGLGKAIREFRKATRDLQENLAIDEHIGKPLAELQASLREDPSARPVATAAAAVSGVPLVVAAEAPAAVEVTAGAPVHLIAPVTPVPPVDVAPVLAAVEATSAPKA